MKQVPGSVYDRSGANRPGPQPGLHHQHMTANNNNNGMPSYVPRMASGAAGAGVNAGGGGGGGGGGGADPYGSRLHDPIGYIAPERAQAVAAMPAMPVPVGVFMNMTHVPPRYSSPISKFQVMATYLGLAL